MQIEVVDRQRARHAECPVWSPQEGALYWVDILDRSLHRLDPATGERRSWSFDAEVGALGMRRGGGLVLGVGGRLVGFDPATGASETIAFPEEARHEMRLNDGKPDRAGRFWVGSVREPDIAPVGHLWRIDAARQVRAALDGITMPNSICWSPDDRTFYFTDTFTRRLMAYDFDADAGEISNPRLFAEVEPGAGVPDGATVDAEGFLWSANINGGMVTRYDPKGRVDRRIVLPVSRPTSCCFGGARMDVLYITTSTKRLTPAQLEEQPLAGLLLAVEVGVAGLPDHAYAG